MKVYMTIHKQEGSCYTDCQPQIGHSKIVLKTFPIRGGGGGGLTLAMPKVA